MEIVFGTFDTLGGSNGTFSHPSIKPSSVIQFTLARDVSEDVDLQNMSVRLIGIPAVGSIGWELPGFVGHDNSVFIHYTILNN